MANVLQAATQTGPGLAGWIGCDPAYAKPCTLAYRCASSGLWCVEGLDVHNREGFVLRLVQLQTLGQRVLVLEDCFGGINRQTDKKLAKVQGKIEAYCDEAAMGLVIVPACIGKKTEPPPWKPHMITVQGVFPKTRAEQKAQAIWIVSKLYGLPGKVTDDIADAVLLSDYGRLMQLNPEDWI